MPAGQYALAVSKPGFVSEQELASKSNVFAQLAGREAMDSGIAEQVGRTPSQTNLMVELGPTLNSPRLNSYRCARSVERSSMKIVSRSKEFQCRLSL